MPHPLLRFSSSVGLALIAAGALAGAITAQFVGPSLVMIFAVWSGNTEPAVPALNFPWLWFAGLMLVVVVCMFRLGKASWRWVLLGHIAAILAAGLPGLHLVHLWEQL